MKQTFKTNINCGSCVRAVSGFLNNLKSIQSWEVDTNHPHKTLIVNGTASAAEIMAEVEDAGFDIVPVEEEKLTRS